MRYIPDSVAAPVAVTAVDLLTETYAPEYNQYANYGMAVLGYGIPLITKRPNQLLTMVGVAAAPVALKALYHQIRGITRRSAPQRLAMRPIRARHGGIATSKPEFAGARLW